MTTAMAMVEGDLREVSDAVLVVGIGRYHQEALAEAYRRHGGAVLGLARRVLRDQGRAEDVTQEVFLWLWHHPEKFDPGRGSLRSYLLAQSHGRAVDVLRSETSRSAREEREGRAAALRRDEVEGAVIDVTVADEVRDALAALAPNERTAIELAYFEGHSYRQVAAVLGEPEGTIKSRIRSGLRRLAVVLRDVGLEPA